MRRWRPPASCSPAAPARTSTSRWSTPCSMQEAPLLESPTSRAQERDRLVKIAESAGLSEAQFDACTGNDDALKAFNDRVEAAAKETTSTSTPTFVINGKPLRRLPGHAGAGQGDRRRPGRRQVTRASRPIAIAARRFAALASRRRRRARSRSRAGTTWPGQSPSAKVTVIEYASAGCPHCADWRQRRVPDASRPSYIDTGQVRFVMRELITGDRRPSPPLASCSRAAPERRSTSRCWTRSSSASRGCASQAPTPAACWAKSAKDAGMTEDGYQRLHQRPERAWTR